MKIDYPIFHAAFQLWLTYYYITLALREHILKVNGSNINAWWIAHHYIAILLSAIVLTWDCDTPAYTVDFSFSLFLNSLLKQKSKS